MCETHRLGVIWTGLPMVIFGGLIHCGWWRSDHGKQHLVIRPKTHQSQSQDDTMIRNAVIIILQQKGHPQVLVRLPQVHRFYQPSALRVLKLFCLERGSQRPASVKWARTATREPAIFPPGIPVGIWSPCSYAVEFRELQWQHKWVVC